jgi:flavin reductase (DIM6/NTAB) family NADH-FMN oxidoreductase RutF
MPVDAQLFKDALARWASGVTVVTTVREGVFKGTTASSFTSVSLDPPLILICLAQNLYTHRLLQETGIFAVSILRNDQLKLGKMFAGMYPEIEDRFAEINVQTAVTGCPILSDAMGWVDCTIAQQIPAGDHTIFVGKVEAAGNYVSDGEPLLYYNRQWGQFSPVKS